MANRIRKVLLVDDNHDHAFLTRATLQLTDDYQVSLATSGKEALELFHKEKFDLALLDYALPDVNGLSVLRSMLEISSDFPVVMITALGSEVVAVEAMKRGAYDYVVKSGDYYKVLPMVIHKALEKYELVISNQELRKRLEQKATKDLLTGIYNKNHFYSLFLSELEAARRYARRLAVVIADVNDFKMINDRNGHAKGDTVLIHVASILKRSVRASDIVARFGGDEFAVLMLEAGQDEAEAMVSRIEAGIERLNAEKTLPTEISLSIGISVSNHNYDSLLEEADQHMYRVKKSYYDKRGGGLGYGSTAL